MSWGLSVGLPGPAQGTLWAQAAKCMMPSGGASPSPAGPTQQPSLGSRASCLAQATGRGLSCELRGGLGPVPDGDRLPSQQTWFASCCVALGKLLDFSVPRSSPRGPHVLTRDRRHQSQGFPFLLPSLPAPRPRSLGQSTRRAHTATEAGAVSTALGGQRVARCRGAEAVSSGGCRPSGSLSPRTRACPPPTDPSSPTPPPPRRPSPQLHSGHI